MSICTMPQPHACLHEHLHPLAESAASGGCEAGAHAYLIAVLPQIRVYETVFPGKFVDAVEGL